MIAYVDTSALAKWYLPERGAEAFTAFIVDVPTAVISRLTILEMRCLLARRRRSGDIDTTAERAAYRLFQDDIQRGDLEVVAVADEHVVAAIALIERLADQPLRTLDALHLAIARDAAATVIATADRAQATAAAALGLEVVSFA